MTQKALLLFVLCAGSALSACSSLQQTAKAPFASAAAIKTEAPESYRAATVSGNYLAGSFAASEGDVNAAATFYADTLKQDPTNNDLLGRAFLFSATAGDIENALSLANRLVMVEPDNRGARLMLAAKALHDADFDTARDEITKGDAGPFTTLTNAALMAWVLIGKGDIDGALQTLNYLSSQKGVQGLYLFQKALILDYADRITDANRAYLDAIAAMGATTRVVQAYGSFLERHGRAADAKTLYAKVLMADPELPIPLAALARMAKGVGPPKLVTTPTEGAAEALFGIAAALTDRRSADVSVFYLNLALYLRPKLDVARVLLADRMETEGNYAAANAQYAALEPDSPYHNLIGIQSALNESRMGRTDDAIARLDALSQRRPNDAQLWSALGDLLHDKGKYRRAIEAYTKALTFDEKDKSVHWNLYYARAVTYQDSGDWEAAQSDLEAALKLSPEQPEVLNYLGYSWVDRGINLKQAVAMLERAHALRPLDGYITDSVGWAYYRLHRYKDAASKLEEAVQLAPGNSTINDHLGDAYWRVGRKLEARFQWRHALSFDPTAGQRDVIARKLELGLDAISQSQS